MFNVGDRVEYVGKDSDYVDHSKLGRLGTVVVSGKRLSDVLWDDKLLNQNYCYNTNLELLAPALDECESFFV